MDKNIEQLIKRFIDGQTTIEEESRIAEYFRTHDVEDEWKAYKDMFAWFDDGMPIQQEAEKHKTRNSKKAKIIAFAMAAAAAIAALIIIATPGNNDIMPVQKTANVIKPSTADAIETALKDTLAIDSVSKETSRPAHKKAKIRRRVYNVMPPKTYLADAKRDSIDEVANQMAEEKLQQIYNEQNSKLQEIYEQYNKQNLNIDLIMAILEEGIDYEIEEENEYY
ncbi:hypothetical protein [Prevotella sp.]|uniref:hypothetical protein n=1 Tax=Prevotella sp. TaxID=59823 RepID=UPI002676DB8F